MKKWIKVTLLAVSTLGIVSCGGAPAGGEKGYCWNNTEHLTKYGTCLHLTKLYIDADVPAYTREKRSLGFDYKDNDFFGDIEKFTYIWSYQTNIDNREITLNAPSDYQSNVDWYIASGKTGTIDVTLTAMDKDEVLDSITETLTVIKRPSPILNVQINELGLGAYENAVLTFRGSDNTQKTALSDDIVVPMHLKAEIIDADEDAASIGLKKELDTTQTCDDELYDVDSDEEYQCDLISDANVTFPLQSGHYTINVTLEDAHGGVAEKNVIIDAPVHSDTFLIDANVSAVAYGSKTDTLFVLTPESLKSYSLNGTPTVQQSYTGFEGAGSLSLSPDGEKLVVLDRNGTYLFDSSDITQVKYHQIARGVTATCNDSEKQIIEIKSNITVAVTDNNQTFFFAENNNSSVILYQMGMADDNLSCFSTYHAYLYSSEYKQTHLHIVDNNTLIKTGVPFGTKFNFNENYSAFESAIHYGRSSDIDSCRYMSFAEKAYDSIPISNKLYGFEGCAWDFTVAHDYDNIPGERYLPDVEDYYTSIMSSGRYVYGSAVLNSAQERNINRFILSYDTTAKKLDTPLRMTKYHQESQSWDYDLFYAFKNRAGKKVGVGRLTNPADLDSAYVLTIEK